MNPNSEINALKHQIKRWTPASDWKIQVTDNTEPAQIAQTMIESSSISQVRVGYALRELFIALGKLFQLYETAEQLSGRNDSFLKDILLLNLQCHQTIFPLFQPSAEVNADNTLRFFSKVIAEIEKDYYDVANLFDRDEEIDILSIVAEYRDAKAIDKYFSMYGQMHESQLIYEAEKESGLTSYLERYNDCTVKWRIRNYRLAEWLLPWIKSSEGKSLDEVYSALFRHERNNKEQAMNYAENILEQMHNEIQSLDVDRQNLKSILHRVTETIQNVGYDDFVDVVTDRGQDGPQSMLGNTSPINLIPSTEKQSGCCREITIMVAKNAGTRGRKNFGSVLRELRSHLVQCFDRTRLVLMLHDEWDQKAMQESELDLKAHQEHGVCFIPLLVRGNQVVKVPLGF
jgi:hypothetical protein